MELINENDIPWPPAEVIDAFADCIRKHRKRASTEWIGAIEQASSDVASMSATEANRLFERANTAPAVLAEPHGKRLQKVLNNIEKRLDTLKVEWLVEKLKELTSPLRKQFLDFISRM